MPSCEGINATACPPSRADLAFSTFAMPTAEFGTDPPRLNITHAHHPSAKNSDCPECVQKVRLALLVTLASPGDRVRVEACLGSILWLMGDDKANLPSLFVTVNGQIAAKCGQDAA
jgi:hypothetical protein